MANKVRCSKCDTINTEGATLCAKCGAPLAQVTVDLEGGRQPDPFQRIQFQRGQVIASRYTVLELIGRGGMGIIYRVKDNTLNEEVALKTLLPQYMEDRTVVDRFFNEAKIARQLSHPQIARVHDIGITGKIIYISMEYIRGVSLRAILEKQPPGQRMPLKNTLRVLEGLCQALAYAHQFTVHRDIKPDNVMICHDGSVKLMDFGISKLMEPSSLTAPSMVMGTPHYMAPEQLRDSSKVDARADIYSVGVLFYELLTGNVPTGVPQMASQIFKDIPPALDPIIGKCMETEPQKRYQSALELMEDISQIRQLVEAGHTSRLTVPLGHYKEKKPNYRKIAGGALTSLVVILAIILLKGMEDSRKDKIAEATALVRDQVESNDPFTILDRLVRLTEALATPHAQNDTYRQELLSTAQEYWKRAEDLKHEGEIEAAIRYGKCALQHYFGLATWSDPSEVFIPPSLTAQGGEDPGIDGFFIDAHEVTNREFARFCEEQKWRDVSPQEEMLPVRWVTFYDALAFAAWKGKRLPTAAQWDRAAFGDKPVNYPWGAELGEENCACATQRVSAVGSYEKDRSPFDVFDIAGNVTEWTRTRADGNEVLESTLGFNDQLRVKGGNFVEAMPLQLYGALPFGGRWEMVGFRCVRELPSSLEEYKKAVEGLL